MRRKAKKWLTTLRAQITGRSLAMTGRKSPKPLRREIAVTGDDDDWPGYWNADDDYSEYAGPVEFVGDAS
jgi:hypothetical protein